MIGRLTGIVSEEDMDGNVIVDVGGVGYEVLVPLGTLGRTQTGDGARVTLHIHTHVREDTFTLYGFATQEDRTAFRTLVGVSSVGPRTALAILSAFAAPDLVRVVHEKNAAALVGVPGVGKKTAERLLLELRDKLTALSGTPAGVVNVGKTKGQVAVQVVDALSRMGFKPSEAERAVASLGEMAERSPLDEVFREALAILRH